VIACRGEGWGEGTLPWVLEGYGGQRLEAGDEMEVLVGLDGGEVGVSKEMGEGVRVMGFSRMGAAGVRNRLVERATGELVVFGNADARPEGGMVAGHVGAHRRMGEGPARMVLGAAPWEKSARPTVFEALLAETAAVFFYGGMKGGEWYDWRHAWTLNLSVRREDFLRAGGGGGFEERLRPVYYEDIALGWKMLGERQGILYEPGARVVHRHPTTLEQYLDREELLGLMAPVVGRVCPEVFAKLFGGKGVEELAREYRVWTGMDGGMQRWIYERMKGWEGLEEGVLGAGEGRRRVLETVYQMHVPLKRLAFRLGFLRGMELAGDERWEERRAVGLWRGMAT
ncbi:MAG TPA: hypothetical protein VH253_09715, partial [Phycisphaerae bacterium]|nr:hypothetical protein [Phycisphaerae bacterium]